ncbi:MAG: phosphatase PAP2 family protein [Pseudomonadota bacterium]
MHPLLLRADAFERRVCIRINTWSRNPVCRGLFRVASRLGDGVAWYTLLVLITIAGGLPAAVAMLHVGLTALAGVYLYKYLKTRLVRLRPFVSHGEIVARTAPLDEFSFPSGHTLHAVLFTVMFAYYVPALTFITLPFMLLVAASRVVLGLHYPTDVIAGAAIGLVLAGVSLAIVDLDPVVLGPGIDALRQLIGL